VRIAELLERAAAAGGRVHAPAGVPSVPAPLELPADVVEFYRRCGGVDLFPGADYC
jgi:hypothetical protein